MHTIYAVFPLICSYSQLTQCCLVVGRNKIIVHSLIKKLHGIFIRSRFRCRPFNILKTGFSFLRLYIFEASFRFSAMLFDSTKDRLLLCSSHFTSFTMQYKQVPVQYFLKLTLCEGSRPQEPLCSHSVRSLQQDVSPGEFLLGSVNIYLYI